MSSQPQWTLHKAFEALVDQGVDKALEKDLQSFKCSPLFIVVKGSSSSSRVISVYDNSKGTACKFGFSATHHAATGKPSNIEVSIV